MARLGVSQLALSQTIRALEERVGLRLLARTTRSVLPTEAGDRLLATIGPRLDAIEADLVAIRELRDKPAGNIRITASEHAANSILLPQLARVAPLYPDVKVEINTDYRMVDIVEQRFDAGVRLGESVAKDMIAVRIGPDVRMAVVGAPGYFTKHEVLVRPQDLTNHDCINVRLPTLGGLLSWDFGLGLAFILEEVVEEYMARGELVRVLEDWCSPFPGYHLYYQVEPKNLKHLHWW